MIFDKLFLNAIKPKIPFKKKANKWLIEIMLSSAKVGTFPGKTYNNIIDVFII